ncbi:maleylpyruvate isomerase family mycothiol-dependent enzyme [Actinophytocola sp.]|uniref:maleylpyruvate isomerase family mycothiol-dependent enzyme n=1 Tax=Actinophytocola sp. TaxID=1872138 RepID=UPI002D7E9D55|nr:maleylpyruvate isomerase family mycothiol-dependent enzyme [Actinophytocola sp.]HET9140605.1 maleylpyruvate isomerase family mycothiol-dependent enzyme [Actinophytocola sp.]
MDFTQYVDRLSEQGDAMRAAAVAAGPEAMVPTCPEWTVHKLVRHMARVHQWAGKALLADPDGEAPAPDEPPPAWDELLGWWDEQRATLLGRLTERGADAPAWTFIPELSRTAAFWARRQTHETAIHRLDAEHALAGAEPVDPLLFDPELAADGLDEALRWMIPRRMARTPATVSGTVLFHAADAGQAWLVRVRPGQPPEVGPAEPGMAADASVVGTADAVYRAAWHRPSHAVKGGDLTLITALRTP